MRGNSHSGFTLIELSIVLVIIGLIVGGVLVGQDMIRTAEIRATISQIEKYKTAVNTFRSKYGGLPGDLVASAAASFGMQARAGTITHGDGDGYIEFCGSSAAYPVASLGCENVLFWSDLSFASLVDASFTTATDAVAINLTTAQISSYLPHAKFGRGSFILALAGNGIPALVGVATNNYYFIGGITSTDGSSAFTPNPTITPVEASQLDTKTDDGLPLSGKVTAVVYNVPAVMIVNDAGGANHCALAANSYNLDSAHGNSLLCMMDFAF